MNRLTVRFAALPAWARLAIAIGGAVLLAVLLIKWAPEWLAGEGVDKDRGEELGRVRTALLASLAGVLAGIGAYYTHRTFELNRAGQITERFTRAIDQLGSEKIEINLGGIYALERIARDSADDHPQVVEVLTAYVRERARWHSHRADKSDDLPAREGSLETYPVETAGDQRREEDWAQPPELPTDVQAAMSVLGRRDPSRDRVETDLNLASTDLRRLVLHGEQAHLERAVLNGAHLEGADLSAAHLERANLSEAHLQGADLNAAHLENVSLIGAHLERAELTRAHLQNAALYRANLQRAELYRAHLQGAGLNDAQLQGALFNEAHLEGATLHRARLEGARLTGARLEGAILSGAHLEGADLSGAHLEDAQLDGAYLKGATYSDDTVWPKGFDRIVGGAIAVGRRDV